MKAEYLKISILIALSVFLSTFNNNYLAQKTKKDSLAYLFVVDKKEKLDNKCPDKTKRKTDKNGRVLIKGNSLAKNHDTYNTAIIEKREHTISFDVVFEEEFFAKDSLKISFDNNKLSFTPEAKEKFDRYIEKTKIVLSKMGEDTSFVLHIQGFASQIPTSFSENKVSNNLNEDGTSILGETSIQNNLDLARARVYFVIAKIQEQLPQIKIVMDEKKDLSIGTMAWTSWHQEQLEIAKKNENFQAMDSLFAPFREDQYVHISSNISIIRIVEPEDVKMYAITTLPRFVQNSKNGFLPINEALIVSSVTYALVGESISFRTSHERDKYLKEKGIDLVQSSFETGNRWFLVSNDEERQALRIENEEEKIKVLLKLGMVHYQDKAILEEILTKEYVSDDRFSYRVLVD